MCKHCNDSYTADTRMRDTPLDENELALFKRLQTSDPAKLAARLPAWIKTHNRLTAAPKRFEFKAHQEPVYPAWITSCGKPSIADASAARKYPTGTAGGTAAYVRSFESMNGLVKLEVVFAVEREVETVDDLL